MIAQTLKPISTESRLSDSAISVLDDIGNTPLLDLTEFARSCGAPEEVQLYAKAGVGKSRRVGEGAHRLEDRGGGRSGRQVGRRPDAYRQQ